MNESYFEEFSFSIDFTELVGIVKDMFYYVLEILNNIVFNYKDSQTDITFSFWTFLVVTFLLDLIAFCLMGADQRNSRKKDN